MWILVNENIKAANLVPVWEHVLALLKFASKMSSSLCYKYLSLLLTGNVWLY